MEVRGARAEAANSARSSLAGWRRGEGEVPATRLLDLRPLADALAHCWPRGAWRERQGSGEGRGEWVRGGSRGRPAVQGRGRRGQRSEQGPRWLGRSAALGASTLCSSYTLLSKTFGLDVLACPRCGQRMRLLQVVLDAEVIAWWLRRVDKQPDEPP